MSILPRYLGFNISSEVISLKCILGFHELEPKFCYIRSI